MTTDLTPRQRRRQRTEQAILDAARQIIGQDGPNALSMRAIAERIDYSAAGLYEYFGGKDEIIVAVSRQGHARLKQAMELADKTAPPDEYLLAISLRYIEFALENPDYFQLMFSSIAAPKPENEDGAPDLATMMAEDESSFPILLRAIERGIESGLFKTRPDYDYGLLELAYTAWSVVHGIAMLRVAYLQHYQLDYAAMDREALRRLIMALQLP